MEKEANISTRLDSKGKMGEFSVWVGDKLVVNSGFFQLLNKQAILNAVLEVLQPTATGKEYPK